MTNNNFFNAARRTLLTMIAIMTVFAGLALADDISLDMEGTTATIPKGNTVTRKIYGIPDFGGTLKLRYKWHAVNIIPNTFNALKVIVKHGSTTLNTKTSCYSTHSNKSPKCDLNLNISQAEAEKSGNWTIVVTNNSNDEVMGFDLRKGSDINPLVPNFKSVYTPNCPDTVNLDMEGTTLTLGKGNTQERKIYGIGHAAGVLRLKAKWHAVNIIPNTFNSLKIELLRPNGTVAKSGTYYSIHSNKSPKFDITYNVSSADANLSGTWKLRITNNSGFEVVGFNIEKESGELNPLVPNFFSSYKANCP